jgi:hypothetical protein
VWVAHCSHGAVPMWGRAITCGYLSLDRRGPSLTRWPRSATAVPVAIGRWLLPVPGVMARLQHLRSVLPCNVRVIAVMHPLFGGVAGLFGV